MLFNKRLLKQKTNKLNLSEISNIDLLKSTLTKWQTALKESDLDKTKETGVQGQFLIKIFEGVLGYKTQSEGGSEWNMFAEPKTDVDSREADGGLGFFSTSYNQTRVVIELKDAKTNLDAKQKGRKNEQSPVEQAFDYLSKFDGCKWAIVSNFKEIRLYSKERGQGFYESIDLLEIGNEDVLKKFLFLFSKENLINKDRDSVIDDLLKDSFVKEQDISKAFYKTYKETRNHLFNHLSSNNPNIDADILLEKAQKILDRVIFICFCEDLDLIPAGIFRKLLEAAKLSFAPSETKVWDQAKGLFHSIDKGNPPLNINKFNGGLFKEDQVLDNLVIKDEIILELLKLSEYDFDSDLNVNILGHIFEQSISDLEEMRSEITEEQTEKKNGKRKKDGIFYTPEYITRYIVDQAVGGWLMDRKKELGFDSLSELTDEDFKSIKTRKGTYKGNNSVEKHRKFWEAYKEKLRNIKVLDPACGSGAFLNQVFDYLYKEGQVVNEAIASLKLGQAEIFDLDKHILNNNIFGVDLNEESVQITKLSLWLKTANKSKELTTLDENIKCGNSLIDDVQVAGEKAFKWKEEFKEIFDSGGFDVVIGNPPYVKIQGLRTNYTNETEYYIKNFQSAIGKFDIYVLFIELASNLIKNKGKVGFILPHKFLNSEYGVGVRKFLQKNKLMNRLFHFDGYSVFEDATTYTCLLFLSKTQQESFEYIHIDPLLLQSKTDYIFELQTLRELTDKKWEVSSGVNVEILNKLSSNNQKLKDLVEGIYQGIVTVGDDIFMLEGKITGNYFEGYSEALKSDVKLEASLLRPILKGKDVSRYIESRSKYYVIYPHKEINGKTVFISENEMQSTYPLIYNYFLNFKDELIVKKKRYKTNIEQWYSLHRPRELSIFEQLKIITPYIASRPSATIDEKRFLHNTKVYSIVLKDKTEEQYYNLLGLLNSKVTWFYIKNTSSLFQGGFYTFSTKFLESLPISEKVFTSEIYIFVKQLIKETERLEALKEKSNALLRSEYRLNLNNDFWTQNEITWDTLDKELIKNKVSLSLTKKEELMNWFSVKQNEFITLKNNIRKLNDDIDNSIFSSYKLSSEDISKIIA